MRAQSSIWIESLEKLAIDFPAQLQSVRGRGYLVGLQMAVDPSPYVTALREKGLLAVAAGGNVIRFLPPLTANPEELAKSVAILRIVLDAQA